MHVFDGRTGPTGPTGPQGIRRGPAGVTIDGDHVTVKGVRIVVGAESACAIRVADGALGVTVEGNVIEIVPGFQGVTLEGRYSRGGRLVRLARRVEAWLAKR